MSAPYCFQCGQVVIVGANFCSQCGADLRAASGGESKASPKADLPPAFSGAPISLGMPAIAFLCYFFSLVCGIIFLFLEPYCRNEEVRFHAWQALFFHLVWLGVSLLSTMGAGLLGLFGIALFGASTALFQVGMFVVWIILLVKAVNGEKYKLPILGDLAERKARGE